MISLSKHLASSNNLQLAKQYLGCNIQITHSSLTVFLSASVSMCRRFSQTPDTCSNVSKLSKVMASNFLIDIFDTQFTQLAFSNFDLQLSP